MFQRLVQRVTALGQEHLVTAWSSISDAAAKESGAEQLMAQLDHIDSVYPGGVESYIKTAQRLLSSDGDNVVTGCDVSVPSGESLDLEAASTMDAEAEGYAALGRTAFVLVAGGLGERLGFTDIKLNLEVEAASGVCYLQLYAEWLTAIQRENNVKEPLPFVLMTSDDTHVRTQEVLAARNYYGLDPSQVILLKQDKVPALADKSARFVLSKTNPFQLETKPHGHGDVHLLLRGSGLVSAWKQRGLTHILFFQDTNAGTTFTAALTAYLSNKKGFLMNSTSIPRRPKEAIGAIARLTKRPDCTDPNKKKELVINVEYNMLEGSIPGGDAADPKTGFSALPGNINTFMLNIEGYDRVLATTNGLMPEFINPKYADGPKDVFKTPARLECMMQDLPTILSDGDAVGFTQFPRWCYSPVKNKTSDGAAKARQGLDPACAASGEAIQYASWVRWLRSVGVASLPDPDSFPVRTFLDVPVRLGPIVSLCASFAPNRRVLQRKLPTPERVLIGEDSALVVRGGARLTIRSLHLKGALVIEAGDECEVVIDGLVVENRGWSFEPLPESKMAAVPEVVRMRGYVLQKHETKTLTFTEPGTYRAGEGHSVL
eukprot:PhM_4_TR9803/c0_g1_i2/m.46682/K12447/USP; UDP-sugar pyrophosphorylase